MTSDSQVNSPSASANVAWKIALVALALRLAFMGIFSLPQALPEAKYEWDWGYEQIAVARSVAEGRGYRDPFRRVQASAPWAAKATGPTAWCGALYPLVLAALLRATDGPNHRTAIWLALFNSLLSASICLALVRLGQGLGRASLGRWSAWAWAFHPAALYFAVTLVWDSMAVAAGIVWLLAFLVQRVQAAPASPRKLVPVGLAFGALGLVNPTALALAPGIALFIRRRFGKRWLRPLMAVALPAALVLTPWSVRNWQQLGTLAPKANFGVELMVGNHNLPHGGFRPEAHPSYNAEEHEKYVEQGEVPYAHNAMLRFQEWARGNPAAFARLTWTRMRHFWIGLSPFEPVRLHGGSLHVRDYQGWIKWVLHFVVGALALCGAFLYRDERCGRSLLIGVIAGFPLVYYVTHVLERYRLPLEPVLVLLAVSAIAALRCPEKIQRP